MSDVIDLSDRGRFPRIWLALAGWTAVAITVALILSAQYRLPLPYTIPSSLAWYYALGAVVWAACRLDIRFELWTKTPARAFLAHTGTGVVAISLWAVTIIALMRMLVGPDYRERVFDEWMFQLLTTVILYTAGVALGLTVQSFDRRRERRESESQLEVLAREAELTAIKAQLQPHFLFNSLNSILALIDHDPAEARRMLTRLASLLHSVFERLDEPLVPLDRELETIRDYLDIERIRFGDRMTFSVEAENGARQLPVPPFLLQPIVENAVKHGIEPYAKPGTVRVIGKLEGARLRLSVSDTGQGIDGTPSSKGRGLTLTRRRLETVYGSDAATVRAERDADGFTVTLDLPMLVNGA